MLLAKDTRAGTYECVNGRYMQASQSSVLLHDIVMERWRADVLEGNDNVPFARHWICFLSVCCEILVSPDNFSLSKLL